MMIIVGILGLIISTAVLLTCGVFWVLFGIVFWSDFSFYAFGFKWKLWYGGTLYTFYSA